MVYGLLVLGLAMISLGLGMAVVLPAPTATLLPLSVGAPELSPWLLAANLLLWGGCWYGWRYLGTGKLGTIALGLITLALILNCVPLGQWRGVNQQAQTTLATSLGEGYTRLPISRFTQNYRASPLSVKALISGIQPQGKVEHHRDILFATPEGVPLNLEIYRPAASGLYPAVVMIYGGAWQRGSPDGNAQLSEYLAAQGYVVWAIAYRHAPQYQFPAQLQDVQAALSFLQTHAAEYDTDPERIAVMGKSAGAHLAMLAAYQPDALPIRAVVDYYGPVDLYAGYYDLPTPDPLDTRSLLVDFLGGTPDQVGDRYRAASPLNFVRPGLPPTLLVYGGKDHIVEARFGRGLAERLQAAGNIAPLIEISWADHAFDTLFNGLSNQLALYYTERFLAWALR